MRMIVPFLMLPDNIYLQKMGDCLQRGAGMIGSLKMQNRLVLRQTVFCWMDWFFRLLLGCYEC